MAATSHDLGLSPTMPMGVDVEHLFDMHIELAPAQVVPSPAGTRMIFVVERGVVAGPRLTGKVLPGGGDWVLMGTDRIGRIDVRATIETDDGALIFITNSGVAALGDEGLELYAHGEAVPWDKLYARSAPLFQTGDERYVWLNATAAIAINELGPRHVNYRVFGVR